MPDPRGKEEQVELTIGTMPAEALKRQLSRVQD